MTGICLTRAHLRRWARSAGIVATLLACCSQSWGGPSPRWGANEAGDGPAPAAMSTPAPVFDRMGRPQAAPLSVSTARGARHARCEAGSAASPALPDQDLLRWHQSVRRLGPLG
jgi:hypothetical protein